MEIAKDLVIWDGNINGFDYRVSIERNIVSIERRGIESLFGFSVTPFSKEKDKFNNLHYKEISTTDNLFNQVVWGALYDLFYKVTKPA